MSNPYRLAHGALHTERERFRAGQLKIGNYMYFLRYSGGNMLGNH